MKHISPKKLKKLIVEFSRYAVVLVPSRPELGPFSPFLEERIFGAWHFRCEPVDKPCRLGKQTRC
jgi:hypothetical protein